MLIIIIIAYNNLLEQPLTIFYLLLNQTPDYHDRIPCEPEG